MLPVLLRGEYTKHTGVHLNLITDAHTFNFKQKIFQGKNNQNTNKHDFLL